EYVCLVWSYYYSSTSYFHEMETENEIAIGLWFGILFCDHFNVCEFGKSRCGHYCRKISIYPFLGILHRCALVIVEPKRCKYHFQRRKPIPKIELCVLGNRRTDSPCKFCTSIHQKSGLERFDHTSGARS